MSEENATLAGIQSDVKGLRRDVQEIKAAQTVHGELLREHAEQHREIEHRLTATEGQVPDGLAERLGRVEGNVRTRSALGALGIGLSWLFNLLGLGRGG